MTPAIAAKTIKVISKNISGNIKDLKNIKVTIDVLKSKPTKAKAKPVQPPKPTVNAMISPDLSLPMSFAREALAAL